MSKRGVEVARAHAVTLPSFPDHETARRALFAERDRLIEQLLRAAERSTHFEPDFTPDSLAGLEKWYLHLDAEDGFEKAGLLKADFLAALTMYFGEVAVRNHPAFEWTVEESHFAPSHYHLGIDRPGYRLMLNPTAARSTWFAAGTEKQRRAGTLRRRYKWMIEDVADPPEQTRDTPPPATPIAGKRRFKDYPPLEPPPSVPNDRPPEEWSSAEARDYFEWLLDVSESRINALLEFLGVEREPSPGELLEKVGETSRAMLASAEFGRPKAGDRILTHEGLSLAADIGLLMARLLTEEYPDTLQWRVLKRPRSDASYNRPVLVGANGMHLDPIALSIALAAGLVNGDHPPTVWRDFYEKWADLLNTPLD